VNNKMFSVGRPRTLGPEARGAKGKENYNDAAKAIKIKVSN